MDNTNLYYIENTGYDDVTKTVVGLTDDEFRSFKSIVEALNKNSKGGCQPTISAYKITKDMIRPARREDANCDIFYILTPDGKRTITHIKCIPTLFTWVSGVGPVIKEGVEKVI